MLLIASLTSPFVRKVRIVLAEKRLEYKLQLEDVWADTTRISASSPLGQVPCLIMDGGEALFDSRVIVEYVDTLSPVGRLIPDKGRARAEVRTWEALADGLMDAAVLARMEAAWSGRTDAQRSQAWIERQYARIEQSVAAMAKGLGDRTWCDGAQFSLADISVGCALNYLDYRFAAIDWRSRYPNLVKLTDKLAQRQSFIDTAPPVA